MGKEFNDRIIRYLCYKSRQREQRLNDLGKAGTKTKDPPTCRGSTYLICLDRHQRQRLRLDEIAFRPRIGSRNAKLTQYKPNIVEPIRELEENSASVKKNNIEFPTDILRKRSSEQLAQMFQEKLGYMPKIKSKKQAKQRPKLKFKRSREEANIEKPDAYRVDEVVSVSNVFNEVQTWNVAEAVPTKVQQYRKQLRYYSETRPTNEKKVKSSQVEDLGPGVGVLKNIVQSYKCEKKPEPEVKEQIKSKKSKREDFAKKMIIKNFLNDCMKIVEDTRRVGEGDHITNSIKQIETVTEIRTVAKIKKKNKRVQTEDVNELVVAQPSHYYYAIFGVFPDETFLVIVDYLLQLYHKYKNWSSSKNNAYPNKNVADN